MTWVQDVKTVSTFPPPGTFNRPAREVARIMASPKVSPKGLGSAIRMVQFFINRAGKQLSARQKGELEKAKHLLQERLARQKHRDARREKSGEVAKRRDDAHPRRTPPRAK